jgi:lysophospholipase L1-like esterase
MGSVRRSLLLAAGVAAVLHLALVGGAQGSATAGYPTGVAAAGDSLSTGFASGTGPGDVPGNSWSTGTNPAVASHYLRILRAQPRVAGRTLVVARDGARISSLESQMERVVEHGDIDYVTVQIGVNDICSARRVQDITPIATFRARFLAAMQVLQRGDPDARVLITSLADEARWNDAVLQLPRERSAVLDGTVCDPRPGPDGRQSETRRLLIQGWEQAYNRVLASVCSEFLHCRYDGGALFRLTYRPQDVSARDAFHPSVSGLARMAAVTWSATFDFGDDTPPRAWATLQPSGEGRSVTLHASDAHGVRGIEYRLGEEDWLVYGGPLWVRAGARLDYRAVDVDGNVSAVGEVTG